MLTRIVIFFGLMVALIAGAFAIDNDALAPQRLPGSLFAQAPAPLPGENSQPPSEPPAPAAAPSVIDPATAPRPAPGPYVLEPSPDQPAPVVVAPPAEPPAPAIVAPAPEAAPATAPVVATPTPLPPEKPAIAGDKKETPAAAKLLFAAKQLPTIGKAVAIGYYPRGCLQGGVALPVNGPTWQVMRLSRNRNWGHPSLVRFLEKFAPAASKATGWKGILVGDMSQPRGGPTPFGHMSHQTGLDVDIWFMPMPGHTLTPEEREKTAAINLVADDWKRVNPKTWTPQHMAFIKTAAEQPGVERVLVNAAIKKELCRVGGKSQDGWMSKVRPWYAHHDHIHVRLKCPEDSPNCRKQPSVAEAEDGGCGKGLDYWFSDKVLHPKPKPPGAKPPRPLTMADLPPACQTVLAAPAREPNN
jgi:penicillin-insensitive murein endopeptidase